MKTIIAGALLGLAVLTAAACSSAGSTDAPVAAATTPTAAAATTAAAAPASTGPAQAAASTFIADGQTLSGTPLYEPPCGGFSCQLSGDSTAFLETMTWSSWTTTSAIGTGTFKVQTCTPNCATGTFYSLPVSVTFSQPVQACSGSTVRWFWTKATFTFLKPLPSALQGQNAPQNPWDFSQLAQSAQQSCS
jgi:hypothetical protein